MAVFSRWCRLVRYRRRDFCQLFTGTPNGYHLVPTDGNGLRRIFRRHQRCGHDHRESIHRHYRPTCQCRRLSGRQYFHFCHCHGKRPDLSMAGQCRLDLDKCCQWRCIRRRKHDNTRHHRRNPDDEWLPIPGHHQRGLHSLRHVEYGNPDDRRQPRHQSAAGQHDDLCRLDGRCFLNSFRLRAHLSMATKDRLRCLYQSFRWRYL